MRTRRGRRLLDKVALLAALRAYYEAELEGAPLRNPSTAVFGDARCATMSCRPLSGASSSSPTRRSGDEGRARHER